MVVLHGKKKLLPEYDNDKIQFNLQGYYPQNMYRSSLLLSLLC